MSDLFKLDKYYIQDCNHSECFTNIFVKFQPLTIDDLECAYKEFKDMRSIV